MESALQKEALIKVKNHELHGEAFCNELLAEAVLVNENVRKLREKIAKQKEFDCNKCYLKGNLVSYEKNVQALDIDGLKKLIELDIQTCKEVGTGKNQEKTQQAVDNF